MELEQTGVSMGKIIARVVGSILFIIPALSFALGLGPITMRSSLNQPLDAEIDIHSVQPGDLDGLAVRLASVEDFARVSVDRANFLTKIQFKLNVRADGSAYITLSTRQPVTEPYLDFLIEARWPRGRALKEYTVLVDPPVLTAETPAPVEQASTSPVFSQRQQQPRRPVQQAQREPARQPVRASTPPPSPPPVRRTAAPVEGEINYGRVKRNDTLWEIALETRPNESISVHQMMLAYLRDNPQAFVEGNINKLKSGYVLRIEDADSIANVTKREAISEIRRQNLAWREGTSTRLVRQVESGDGETTRRDSRPSSSDRERSAAVDADARLELVAPGTEGRGSGGASADGGKELQEDLLRATETLDANRQESEELQSRFAELEEQMQSMQRLIMLKDEELLALQNQLGVEPEVAQKPEKPATAPQKQGQDPAPDDGLLSDPVLLILGGLLVVAVVGWLVVRRRKMQDGFEESILNVGMAHKAGAEADTNDNTVLMNKPVSAAGGRGAESAMVSDFAMSELDGFQGDSADVDPVSEADVYLAYGRHQQAQDIINQALEKSPDRLELQAKLLEVLHAAKNVTGFETQARLLHEKIGGDETNPYWNDIVSLGRELCPHSDLFGGSGAGTDEDELLGAVSEDEQDLMDFDFDTDTEQADSAESLMSATEDDDALDFDVSSLDFDMDAAEEQAAADVISEINALDDDNGFEFDTETAFESTELETAATKQKQDDDGALDFDLSFDDDDDTEIIDLKDVNKERADEELDFGSLNLEEDTDTPIELEAGGGESLDDSILEFDYTADVVALDPGDDELDLDGELDEDIFSNVDEVGTKLDLAKAYVDMGDSDGARSILDEVLEEGDDSQKQQAEELLQQMG